MKAALLLTSACVAVAMRMELHRIEDAFSVKRDRDSLRQLRRLSDGKYEGVPLNLGMGTHYAWVYAGSPPQRASVIVDTGSHIMAFPCSGCKGCGKHTDAVFDAAQSSTLRYPQCTARPPFQCSACSTDNKCHISQSYTEGSSWEAVLVEDNVWLGDATPTPTVDLNGTFGTRFMFGCQKRVTGQFVSQVADGIMGVSDTPSTNIVRKLYQEKKIPHNAFSLCFTPTGGTMALGSLTTPHQQEPLQYAMTSTNNNGWYAVHVEQLRLGNKLLDVDVGEMNSGRHRVIVDSGTTDSYFPARYASTWNTAFELATGEKYQVDDGNCAGYSPQQVETFPDFEMDLQGVNQNSVATLRIPASQYIVKNSQGLLIIVLGIVWRLFFRKRSRADKSWTSVPTLQEEAEEEEDHGHLPDAVDAEAGMADDDDDEFFDSEGYVMSPRSLRKCKEAFEM
uniref:Secreted protein n=1 Tax=Achlya hypogyna TaxID=1202772 RepID=A0A0A7CMV3_ACHHY|nr:secreted protein [Achlya hypogyna]